VPAGLVLALAVFAFTAPLAPLDSHLAVPGTVILDASGGVIERDIAAGTRIPVTLDRIAPVMVAATVAAEDQRFRSHPGIDPLAMARAAVNARSNPSGASTITQQLVRGTYLAGADLPLPLRKAREAVLAIRLEASTSKDEVIEAYLNEIYYGRGAYGVEAAARAYFGVAAADLDLAQAAFLAGLPRSPSTYDSPEGAVDARARQAYVLDRMAATGVTTAVQAAAAAALELRVAPAAAPLAPHLSAFVYDELRRVLSPEVLAQGGLVVETTLDAGVQREAEASVARRLDDLREHRAGSAAVVVLDPRDGRLLALVGSADYAASAGQINMALEPRQPGSALKPLLYAAALEHGYTAASPLLDVPSTFVTSTGPYAPVNYDLHYRGPVPLRVALASSLNVPAVRTLEDLGVDALLQIAHRAGLSSLDAAEAYGLALTLGGGGVRLLDLTAAYGAFADGGQRHQPWVVARVRDHTGRVLYERAVAPGITVTSPQVAYLVADMLADADARIPGFGARTMLDTSFNASVKTGTSSEFRDNWTIGFTAERVVGVWVGNADQQPMRNVSGVTGAAPIWRDVITAALEGTSRARVERPAGLVRASVCAPTGLLPGADCPATVDEWFIAGTEPRAAEHYYHRVQGGALAIDPPAEARAWAVDAGWRLWDGASSSGSSAAGVNVVQPVAGAVLYQTGDVSGSLLLRASAPASSERVEFYVDGVHAGSATAPAPSVVWQLQPGEHEILVVVHLADGREVHATSSYKVVSP